MSAPGAFQKAIQQPKRRLTVAQALSCGKDVIEPRSPSASLDAARLLEHVTGYTPAAQIARGEAKLSFEEREEFARLCERRACGVPVAYLTGRVWFYGREFAVDERVLIPRPETEHLVDETLAYARTHEVRTVLDVGAGSGALACTIAAELRDAAIDATEASAAALSIARENARRLGVAERCRLQRADGAPLGARSHYDVILANLPYVPSAELPQKPDSAAFEPVAALDGGPDGLAEYRKLLSWAPPLLRPQGLLLLETAPQTAHALQRLTAQALPDARIAVQKDYAGEARVLRAEL